MKRQSCAMWAYFELKKGGIKLPTSWKKYTMKSNDDIIANEKELLEKKEWFEMFASFLSETKQPVNGDVICHHSGVGFYVNGMMKTINKFNDVVIRNIPSKSKIFKVIHD